MGKVEVEMDVADDAGARRSWRSLRLRKIRAGAALHRLTCDRDCGVLFTCRDSDRQLALARDLPSREQCPL